jgi:WD40 repeat protein
VQREAANADGPAIKVLDRDGIEIHTFRQHSQPVFNVRFSPNGRLILSQTLEGEGKIWEADTGKVRRSFTVEKNIKVGPLKHAAPVAADSSGALLTLPGAEGRVIVRFDDLREVLSVGKARGVYFSPDGKRLVTVEDRTPPLDPAEAPPPAPPGQQAAPRARVGTMKLWDLEAEREIASAPLSPAYVAFSPRGDRFLTMESLTPRDAVTVWDALTGQKQATLEASRVGGNLGSRFTAALRQPRFSPDGSRVVLAAISEDARDRGIPSVFDLATGERLFRLEGLREGAASILYSPDGKRIATISPGGEIKLWDAATGRELLSLQRPGSVSFGTLTFSADGRRLIFSGPDGLVVWDATPRQER